MNVRYASANNSGRSARPESAPDGSRHRGFRIPGREADMVLIAPDTVRPRGIILIDLGKKLHAAGRMTVNDPRYERLHGEIDALLDELAAAD